MELSVYTKVAMGIFTFVAVGFILFESFGFVVHLRTEPWTKHALFHMITGLFYLQAICVLIVVLTWFPFREAEYWSWWAILFAALSVYGTHFLGDPLTGGGLHGHQTAAAPPWVLNFLNVLALVTYAFALGISYQHFL